MCGIYACLGDSEATNKVLAGLKRIEYRGYDSWGIATSKDGKLNLEKYVGKISKVKKISLENSFFAIGHTRWATHGGVTKNNAHPHLAKNKSFALVQNGVLENYSELKKELQKDGYKFTTQTDTEVIVALIEQVCGENIEAEKLNRVIKKLTGRNTILILTKNGQVWAHRQGSPLIVGKDQKENYFFSSDLASISHDAKFYHVMENGELIHLDQKLTSNLRSKIVLQKISQKALEIDKGEYKHFMLKEIFEQPESLLKVIQNKQELLKKIANKIESSTNIYVVGAGSASYAANSISHQLRRVKDNVYHVPAYDYNDFAKSFKKNDLAIILSQSGETADTIEAVEFLKSKGVTIISVVNMPGSSLMQMADLAYPLDVGAEIGVASTKALTAHMLFGMALVDYLEKQNFSFLQEVEKFCQQLEIWLKKQKEEKKIQGLAKFLRKKNDLYILGRGQLLSSALEFALKVKEVSYLHAEGFSAGELKHGVIALIEKNTPVICLLAPDQHREDMVSAAHEVQARGAKVIGIAMEKEDVFDYFIQLPNNEKFINLSTIVVAQLLTYELALIKKLDPDKPRNLAKSVTVK